jgi:hypothetical protein
MLFACVAAALLFAPLHAPAQETTPDIGEVARKFDEFTRVGGCDHSARLDNFAITLMQNPELVGYVIAYGPEGDGSGSGNFRLHVSKDYLLNSRGLDAERIRTIYGGRYKNLEESASELWIAPRGAEAPQPVKYENNAVEFTGKFIEQAAWDGLSYGDESTGPPIGDVSLANFADMLRLQPGARGYIVVFNKEESTPGAWRRVATRERDKLQTDYGIQADRVKIIFGGYEKEAKVQYWILPESAPPPVKEVKHERKLMKAVQFGTFTPFQLKDKESEEWIFKGFAEELRNDENLRACVIIRSEFLGVKEAEANDEEQVNEEETAAAAEPPVEQIVLPDEAPDVDPAQLVEKWKKELVKQYGVGENRLVVIIAPARNEYRVGEIEAWIVPNDAALPDPYAEEGRPWRSILRKRKRWPGPRRSK